MAAASACACWSAFDSEVRFDTLHGVAGCTGTDIFASRRRAANRPPGVSGVLARESEGEAPGRPT